MPTNYAKPASTLKTAISRRTMQIPVPQQIRIMGIVKKAFAATFKLSPSAADGNPTPKIQASDLLKKS